jgi:hypothetical protein
MLIDWSHNIDPPLHIKIKIKLNQSCELVNVEWVAYLQHSIQFPSKTCIFNVPFKFAPDHIPLKCKISVHIIVVLELNVS